MEMSVSSAVSTAIVLPVAVNLLNSEAEAELSQLDGESLPWRQDNAGENKGLEENMKGEHWLMKTKFKYTAPGTPQ